MATPAMPDGLTRLPQSFADKDANYLKGIERSSQVLDNLAKIILSSKNVEEKTLKELNALKKDYQQSLKDYKKSQDAVTLHIKELQRAGATEAEITAYLKKHADTLTAHQENLVDKVKDLSTSMGKMVSQSEFGDSKSALLAARQIEILEKNFEFDQEMHKKKVLPFYEKMGKAFEDLKETGNETKNTGLAQVATTLLGPLRLLTDPILELAGTDTETVAKNMFEKMFTKREEEDDPNAAVAEAIASKLDEESIGSLTAGEVHRSLPPGTNEESPEVENSLPLWEDDPSMEKLNPDRQQLLAKGGVYGAGAVFIADTLLNMIGKGGQVDEDEEGGPLGMLGQLMGGKGGGMLAKFLPFLKAAAVTAIPAAMLAGGLILQQRDTEDASTHFDRGDSARGFETLWLGDRDRLTEENAGAELARATGKTALLAGGVAGLGAVAGTAGAALAGGAGLAGAAGAVTLGAVLPPVLIAAAIAAGVTAVAKGTQEAYALEWDKNLAEINKELTAKMLDPDANIFERMGAGIERGWKNFTSTIAGGIRGVTDMMDEDAKERLEEQISILSEQAAAGNAESARMLELMSSEAWKGMTEKEREELMKSEALLSNYKSIVAETAPTLAESVGGFFEGVGNFFKGGVETALRANRGQEAAFRERVWLDQMDEALSGADVERLKASEEFAKSIAEGASQYEALQAAYLAEKNAAWEEENRVSTETLESARSRLANFGGSREELNAVLQDMEKSGSVEEFNLAQQIRENMDGFLEEFEKNGLDSALDQNSTITLGSFELGAKQFGNNISNFVGGAWENVSGWFGGVQENLQEKFTQVKDGAKKFFEDPVGNIRRGLSTIGTRFGGAITGLRNGFTNVVDGAKRFFEDPVGNTKNFLENLGKGFGDTVENIKNGFGDFVGNVKTFFEDPIGNFKEAFSNMGDWLGESMTSLFGEEFTQGVVEHGNNVRRFFDESMAGIGGFFSNMFGGGAAPVQNVNDAIIKSDGSIIHTHPDDNIIATKNDPQMLDAATNGALSSSIQGAGPTTVSAVLNDGNIVSNLQKLIETLENKNFSPVLNTGNTSPDFNSMRSAGGGVW